MAAPAFADKGTAANTAAADNVNVTCPATVNANDILIIHALTKDNIEINTPSGFTAVGARNQGTSLRSEWFWKRADGTEDGATINVSRASGTTNLLFAQVYRFTGCVTTGDPYEGHAATGDATNPVDPADCTTTAVDRLIVVLTAVEDDLITAGDFTGGTATVAEVAEDATATGTDGNLHVAAVEYDGASTFDPGGQSLANNRNHNCFTFALLPIAGGDVTVEHVVGTLVMTATAPVITERFTPSPGILVLGASDPSVAFSGVVTGTPGTLVLTASEHSVVAGVVLAATVGTLVLAAGTHELGGDIEDAVADAFRLVFASHYYHWA